MRPGLTIRTFLWGIALSFIAFTAAGQPGTTPAAANPQIKSNLAAVDKEILETVDESAKYSGGLIKSLIEARLAVLRQTRAMLDQRLKASDLNVTIRYTVEGRPFALPPGASDELTSIEAELEALKAKIATAEAEAARYTGGLVQAMSVSSLATMRQTQAMLDQKRLSLKYDLPQFVGFADAKNVTPSFPTPPVTAKPESSSADRDWEIVAVDSKVTESNATWWKYAWKLTLHNNGSTMHAFNATIEFQDKDGFIIDTSRSEPLVVQPNAAATFTGYALIRTPGASNVARTLAKVAVVR